MDFPLWYGLVNELVQYFWENRSQINRKKLTFSHIESLKNNQRYAYVMDYLFSLNKELFYSGVEESLGKELKSEAKEKIYFLRKLCRARFPDKTPKYPILTTNLDTSIEKCFNISNVNYSQETFIDDVTSQIFYLHGRIHSQKCDDRDRRKDWILTQEDYLNQYLSEISKLNVFLQNIFNKKTVIFVGYGLKEFEILQAIAKRNSIAEKEFRIQHYAFQAIYKLNENEVEVNEKVLKDRFNIHLLKFGIELSGWDGLMHNFSYLVDAICDEEYPEPGDSKSEQ